MEIVINSIIGFMVPTILSALIASVSVGGVIWKKMTSNNRQDAMLLALGRYRLVEESEKVLKQNYITPTQYEMLSDLHDAYGGLHGNSVGDALYYRASKLKIMEVEDAND